MDCKSYSEWLENRDLSDISESDRAVKHANTCESCRKLTEKDEALNRVIAKGLAAQPSPDHLERLVALNLGRSTSTRRYSTGMIKFASLCAGVAALVLVFLFMPSDRSARKDFGGMLALDHQEVEVFHPLKQPADINGWIARNAGFPARMPADFDRSKLRFVGLRICFINDCRTVHLVYRDGEELVSLFIAPVDQVPVALKDQKVYSFETQGETIRLWRNQRQVYGLVI